MQGKPHENRRQVQEAARALQGRIPEDQQNEPERALFAHWRDSSDAGLLQEVIKVLAANGHRKELAAALQEVRASRQLPARAAQPGQQLTLENAWARVLAEPPPSREPWTTEEDPATQHAREQLWDYNKAGVRWTLPADARCSI